MSDSISSKILKKSGLQTHQFRHFYLSVIRPILEYCYPIWHHGLIKAQTESLEAIKRRVLRIIDSSTVGMPYEVALSLTKFVSLHDRREHLNKFFFYFHNYSVFLYLPPPPSTQRLQHYLQITCSITIPQTCNPH